MPAEKLIQQFSPDLTPPFYDWLLANLQEIARQDQLMQAAKAAAVQGSTDSDACSPVRQPQPAQQLSNPAAAAAPPGSISAGATNKQPASAAGGAGIEALRARMNQLQASKANTHLAAAPAHGSAPGALVGTNTTNDVPSIIPKATGIIGPVAEGSNAISNSGIGAAPALVDANAAAVGAGQAAANCSIADIKSRFQGMHLSGQ